MKNLSSRRRNGCGKKEVNDRWKNIGKERESRRD